MFSLFWISLFVVCLLKMKMADAAESQKLLDDINYLNLSDSAPLNNAVSEQNISQDPATLAWGFPLLELYKLGLRFYKDNEGKAISLSYENKLKLVAFSQQVSNGTCNSDKQPPLGVLDVIGKDRRDAWQSLGNMSRDEAKQNFIELLDKCCPAFKPFLEAQKADIEMKKRQAILKEEEKIAEEERELERQEQLKKDEIDKEVAEERKRQIQDALNAQTFHQFKEYAEQQYPGNPEQQAVLVRQLQEQHYHQYIQQLLQQQHQAVQTNTSYTDSFTDVADKSEQADNFENRFDNDEDQEDGLPPISPPSMWTRNDVQEFKESIKKEGGEAIIKVGRGETVTVRVPTHDDGTCLFWEFATDSYDIGFGVYFEWTKSETNQVSVHIQDSDDEEDDILDEDDFDDEELSEYDTSGGDVETGSRSKLAVNLRDKPLLSAIVPIFRRDCQSEVYAGSHVYPGQGVYLLKFDNSYSLWRSKTLYYRVYYTR